MTPQEAIKYLEITRRCTNDDSVGELQNQMCDVAIEALKKQVPTAPDYEGDGYADTGDGMGLLYDTWICPYCGVRYEVDYDEYNYCPNCGQAIRW